jgi:Domain of unknown function (DUF4307)
LTTTTTGKRRDWLAYAVIGVFVAICAVGWAIISTHTEGNPSISPEIVSWQLTDRSVNVRYEIGKAKGDNVHCALIAYDTKHAEVGRVEVTVPPGTGNVDRRQEVPTTSRATAVDVQECRAG